MIQFGELAIEVKSGILFCLIAFIFSIFAGFAGGVPAGMVFFRGFIIAPVFFVVGFGIILVIKKFVPELYEMLSNLNTSQEDDAGKVEINIDDASGNAGEENSEKSDSGFSEFTEKDYERLQSVRDSDRSQTVGDSGLDGVLNTSGGKLGKHIIVDNQMNSYEPKLMALAIRTMMSKDKD